MYTLLVIFNKIMNNYIACAILCETKSLLLHYIMSLTVFG